MTDAVRQYTPIWNALKVKGTVKITAPVAFHRRIIRAVIKEKDMDMGFKFEVSESGKPSPRISYKKVGSIIEFKLVWNSRLEGL